MTIIIRDVKISDAQGIINILNPIIKTKKYTVLDKLLSLEDQITFISNFPDRGVFNVAVREEDHKIMGLQSLEPFATYTKVFDHVAVIGTFVDLSSRRLGIGSKLTQVTFDKARKKGFEKIFTYILESNKDSLNFYLKIGFTIIGTAKKQAKIDDRYHDEVLIEKFL